MKTYIQLEPDRSKGHWKFQHDPDTQPPLSELYTPEIVALMVDVSEYEQEPGETWEFDGVNFITPPEPPPPVVIEPDPIEVANEQLATLKDQAIPLLIAAVAGDEEAKAQVAVINEQMAEVQSQISTIQNPVEVTE